MAVSSVRTVKQVAIRTRKDQRNVRSVKLEVLKLTRDKTSVPHALKVGTKKYFKFRFRPRLFSTEISGLSDGYFLESQGISVTLLQVSAVATCKLCVGSGSALDAEKFHLRLPGSDGL